MSILHMEREDGLALITINRLEALNALNREVLEALKEQLFLIDQPIVVLTGSGSKAFVSGADIKEMAAMKEKEWRSFVALGNEVIDFLESAPFISIAAVNGYCLGGGLELALACDLIFAKEDAEMGMPEAKLGAIPSFGGVKRLMDAIGERQAKELMITGRRISAEEALELGLINRVCSGSALVPECRSFAREILKNDWGAVLAIKRKELYYFNFEERNRRMGKFK